jgi:hypothetical protein
MSNIFIKNESLKNMFQRVSEEAKKHLNNSSHELKSTSPRITEIQNMENFDLFPTYKVAKNDDDINNITSNFDPINKDIIEIPDNELVKSIKLNENFTQEFFMERYKDFIPSKLVTPSDFNKNCSRIYKKENAQLGQRTQISYISPYGIDITPSQNNPSTLPENMLFILKLIESKFYLQSDLNNLRVKTLNFTCWMACYMNLNEKSAMKLFREEKYLEMIQQFKRSNNPPKGSQIESFDFFRSLDKFFSLYSKENKKEVIIAEIVMIKQNDNILIFELIDYNLTNFEIIVICNDDNQKNNKNLKPKSVLIINSKSVKEVNSLKIVDLSNIKHIY